MKEQELLPAYHEVERPPWEDTISALARSETSSIRIPRNTRNQLKREIVVDAFMDAFEIIGGTSRLALWADENPTEFYRLYGKLVPKEAKTESTGEVKILHSLPRSSLDAGD